MLGSIYRRHGSAVLLGISPLIQPHGLLGTVKSKVQCTGRCTVQSTVHCTALFSIQYCMWDVETLTVAVQGIQGRLKFHWYFQMMILIQIIIKETRFTLQKVDIVNVKICK